MLCDLTVLEYSRTQPCQILKHTWSSACKQNRKALLPFATKIFSTPCQRPRTTLRLPVPCRVACRIISRNSAESLHLELWTFIVHHALTVVRHLVGTTRLTSERRDRSCKQSCSKPNPYLISNRSVFVHPIRFVALFTRLRFVHSSSASM